jgi:hypothetical protein
MSYRSQVAVRSWQATLRDETASRPHNCCLWCCRFVTAVKTAIAAHKPSGRDSQSIPTLLSTAPLLLACDASCLDFWQASAASTEHAQVCVCGACLGGWFCAVRQHVGGGFYCCDQPCFVAARAALYAPPHLGQPAITNGTTKKILARTSPP